MRLRTAAIAVFTTLFMYGGAAHATTLDITGHSVANGIFSFQEIPSSAPEFVGGVFLGSGDGEGTILIDASQASAATVLAIALELTSDSPIVANVVLNSTPIGTIIGGDDTLNIPAMLLAGSNVLEFFVTGVAPGELFTLTAGITAVPLPGAAWLFITALSGMFAARRRRFAAA